MPNQRELAKILNLSPGTISRALRNFPGVDAKTRSKVLEQAARMGYSLPQRSGQQSKINANAKKNEEQHRKTIGVLISRGDRVDKPQEVPLRLLQGMSDVANLRQVQIFVDCVAGERANQLHLNECQSPAFQNGQVDGLLLIGLYSKHVIKTLSEKYPCIWLSLYDPQTQMDRIMQDNISASHQLISHLVELGHRKIGFLAMPHDLDFIYGQARWAGYLQALAQYKLPIDMSYSLGCCSNEKSPVTKDNIFDTAVEQTRNGVSAWVAVHDEWGYKLINHLQNHDIEVPTHASVVGYDNVGQANDSAAIRLTSIAWPFEDIGASGMQQLLSRIENPSQRPVHMLWDGRLIVEKSTGIYQQL